MSRSRQVGWASLALGILAVILAAGRISWSQDPAPQPQARAAQPATAAPEQDTITTGPQLPTPAQLEAWKKQFPYVSLADRLAYEHRFRDAPAPTLSDEAAKYLESSEEKGSWEMLRGSMRGGTLRMLHTGELAAFMSRPGFGMTRMPMPGPSYLEPDRSEPIEVAKLPPLSGNYVADQAIAIPANDKSSTPNPWRVPSRERIGQVHRLGRALFASAYDFGDVKSLEEVAGFNRHGICFGGITEHLLERPSPGQPQDVPQWKIARLELVSLLKHETPSVYVSEYLPRMDELKDAKTRTLTDFEKAGLDKLIAGEELFVESHGNTIEMVGAIRCVEQCRACHEIPRGTLLGAFSYDLQRDPPVLPVAAPQAR